MKRYIIFLLLLFFTGSSLWAQVAINKDGSNPDSSAMLHIKADSLGVLIPNVALTSTEDTTTIPKPAVSLLVYNTANTLILDRQVGNPVVPGFYYWTGAFWAPLSPDGDWTVSGADMYANPSGKVGIGLTNPQAKLHVNAIGGLDGILVSGANANGILVNHPAAATGDGIQVIQNGAADGIDVANAIGGACLTPYAKCT